MRFLLFVGGAWCILFGAGRLVFVFLGDSGLRFLLPISEHAETFSLESVEVNLLEQQAVSWTAWKDGIHEAEVSCSGHGVGFPSVVVNQRPPMIAWCDDLWKQGPVLCATGNDEAAAFVGSLADWILIRVLKQRAAHAGMCVYPCCVGSGSGPLRHCYTQ